MDSQNFLEAQRKHPRYRTAEEKQTAPVRQMFQECGLPYPPPGIFLRLLKREQSLELWARRQEASAHQLVKSYAVCAIAGGSGPKRREDDGQTPEGFYHIEHFDPASHFFFALQINYPNRLDRILGDRSALGGEISIHGGHVTMGSIPITDEMIQELYVIAVAARAQGQEKIPVHIFPRGLDAAGFRELAEITDDPALIAFWKNLMVGYNYFETTRLLPEVSVMADGRYLFAPARVEEES
jgi:murein L,D-transpeptidase YafK